MISRAGSSLATVVASASFRSARRGIWLLAAAAAAVVLAAPSTAHPSKAVAGAETFVDPTGDNGSNPDITQVKVSNDNAGLLTLEVAIGNRTGLAETEFVTIFLDTDSNGETGDRNGMDYGLSMGSTAVTGVFAKWTGTGTGFRGLGWTTIVGSSTFTAVWAGGPRFTISQAALDDTSRFLFYAAAGEASTALQDDAPDGSELWAYKVDTPLLFKGFALEPTVPKAGKLFRARIQVRTNTSEARPVRCQAKLGGKALRGRGSWFSIITLAPGPGPIRSVTRYEALLTCEWTVPRNAKGKRLSGSISATNDGVTVARTFANRVR